MYFPSTFLNSLLFKWLQFVQFGAVPTGHQFDFTAQMSAVFMSPPTFYIKLFFIRVQLLYNIVLVSIVQQNEITVCSHISPLFWISFPFRSPRSTVQNSLCYKAGSHQLSIFYITVYICQSQSTRSSHPPVALLFTSALSLPLLSTLSIYTLLLISQFSVWSLN